MEKKNICLFWHDKKKKNTTKHMMIVIVLLIHSHCCCCSLYYTQWIKRTSRLSNFSKRRLRELYCVVKCRVIATYFISFHFKAHSISVWLHCESINTKTILKRLYTYRLFANTMSYVCMFLYVCFFFISTLLFVSPQVFYFIFFIIIIINAIPYLVLYF